MRKFWILSGVIAAGLVAYSAYRLWEEGRIAKEITITVKDSSNTPIPATIIRLERKTELENQGLVKIQLQTDEWGTVYLKSLTPGQYNITAIQVRCEEKEKEVETITLNIQGQRTHIQYFPCG